MKEFKGIIFDIDGTLASTNKLIFASFNHIMEKYLGKTYPDEEIIKFFGPPEDVILKKLLEDKFDEGQKDYYTFYFENHERMVKKFPGMIELVRRLKEQNITLGIYTGKGRRTSEITLEKLGVFRYFDLILTGDDLEEPKPSASAIKRFLDQFELTPSEALMIGDAPSDVIAAHGAGVKAASVVWDSYAKEKVLEMNSDYCFESVEELEKFLELS